LTYEGWQRTNASGATLRALVNRPLSLVREMLSAGHTLTLLEDDLSRACELIGNKAVSFVIQFEDKLGVALLDRAHAFRFFRRLLNFSPYKLESRIKYDLHLDNFACD
jgi:hypothetical protein